LLASISRYLRPNKNKVQLSQQAFYSVTSLAKNAWQRCCWIMIPRDQPCDCQTAFK